MVGDVQSNLLASRVFVSVKKESFSLKEEKRKRIMPLMLERFFFWRQPTECYPAKRAAGGASFEDCDTWVFLQNNGEMACVETCSQVYQVGWDAIKCCGAGVSAQGRMVFWSLLLWIAFCADAGLGDVQILFPSEKTEVYDLSSGSTTLHVEWMVTDEPPDENEIESYTFTLVAGGNAELVSMYVFESVQASSLDADEMDLRFESTVGTNGLYMLQVMSTCDGGYTIHYSHRFELTGMAGAKLAPSTDDRVPPGPERRVFDDPLAGGIDTRSFTVPYHLQTGRAKFAPMQLQPPTKITRSQWTRIHETSAVKYFTSCQAFRQQLTTVTPGWSYLLPSGFNDARPAPMPSANGGWHAATRRLSRMPRKTNTYEAASVT